MKQDCKLIATLPSLDKLENIETVFRSIFVDEVRFNTGSQSPYSEAETLKLLHDFSIKYRKKVWIDLKGYLTEKNERYLRACESLGMRNIMASFVEGYDDLTKIFKFIPKAEIVAKIESKKVLNFVLENSFRFNLMAVREDLYIELEHSPMILSYLKRIAMKDLDAICATKIFSSLKRDPLVSLTDYEDLELMYEMGYRNFMLYDDICNHYFKEAMKAWEEFVYV